MWRIFWDSVFFNQYFKGYSWVLVYKEAWESNLRVQIARNCHTNSRITHKQWGLYYLEQCIEGDILCYTKANIVAYILLEPIGVSHDLFSETLKVLLMYNTLWELYCASYEISIFFLNIWSISSLRRSSAWDNKVSQNHLRAMNHRFNITQGVKKSW